MLKNTPQPAVHEVLAASTPVATVVAMLPAMAQVFERHGIDYCCRGGRHLKDAAAERGLDLHDLQAEYQAVVQHPSRGAGIDRTAATITELCDLIERTHHAFMRQELPRARELCRLVEIAHGERHPELGQLKAVLRAFHDDIESHMQKEEGVLFPLLRRLEQGVARQEVVVEGPIACMVREHDSAREMLATIRNITSNFQLPTDACPTFRTLYESLEAMDRDMHTHVHTENWILFPKVK